MLTALTACTKINKNNNKEDGRKPFEMMNISIALMMVMVS